MKKLILILAIFAQACASDVLEHAVEYNYAAERERLGWESAAQEYEIRVENESLKERIRVLEEENRQLKEYLNDYVGDDILDDDIFKEEK